MRFLLSSGTLFVLALVSLAGATAAAEPVTLRRAQQLTLARYPTMLNFDERVVQAEALTRRAWAILLPSLKANASVTRNDQEIAFDMSALGGPAGDKIVITELWGKRFGLSANMVLFKASALPLLKNAYDNLEQQRELGRFDKNEVLFVVARAFYQMHTTEELVRAAEENLKVARQFEREAELRKKVGQATRIDLLRAQIQVTSAARAADDARDAVKLARYALATLTGLKGEFDIAPPPRPEDPGQDLQHLEQQALQQRRDLGALKLAIEIAERDRLATWLKWVPDLDVTYNWRWDSASGFAGDNDSWQLIFGARWSLLEGGGRFAEIAERGSQVRVSRNQLKQRRLEVREQVRTARVALDRARRNLQLAQRQLELAQESHDAVSKQYKQGLATSLDVQSAFNELQDRRAGMVVQQLSQDLALLDLRRVSGGLNPLLKR